MLEKISHVFEIKNDQIVYKNPTSICCKVGQEAGTLVNGHYRVMVAGDYFPLSKIAWALLFDEWPNSTVYFVTGKTAKRKNLTKGRCASIQSVKIWEQDGVILKNDGWHCQEFGPFLKPQQALSTHRLLTDKKD